MRILIVNAHSCCNLGDAAILITMMESLAREFPQVDFVVVSDTPERDASFYEGVKVIGIAYPWQAKSGLAFWLTKGLFYARYWATIAACRLFGSRALRLLPRDAAVVVEEVLRADLVVSCGGGYLSSLGKLFARLSLMLSAVVFGKPNVWYSQSVSDLSSALDRFLVRATLNRTGLFIARESITCDYLVRLGVNPDKIKLQADSAFLLRQLPLPEEQELVPPRGKEMVGLTVTRWSFPGHKNSRELTTKYIESMRQFATYLTRERGLAVVVFPQVTGPSSYSDDRAFGREIFGALQNPHIIILSGHYKPGQLKSLIGTMSTFVGTRMHSNIFALGARVPTLAIAYQDKTAGIMEMLGLGDFVLPINALSFETLKDAFDKVWTRRAELKDKLTRTLPEIQQSALAASAVCKGVYCSEKSRTTVYRPLRGCVRGDSPVAIPRAVEPDSPPRPSAP